MLLRSLLRVTTAAGFRQTSWMPTTVITTTSHYSTIPKDAFKDKWESLYRREVARTMEELGTLMRKEVDSPPDAKILKVAIVGVPNSGKSTLINSLIRWKVFSVSSKVHTTLVNARGVINEGETQLVFLDTPGLVTPLEVSRHRLNRTLLSEAEMSLLEVDLVAVVHDVSDHFTRNFLHPRVLRLLALHPTTPSVLLLNKVDKTKNKQTLLDMTRSLTEGIVGGQKAYVYTEKKNQYLNKDYLISKTNLNVKNIDDEPQYSARASENERLDKCSKTIDKVIDTKRLLKDSDIDRMSTEEGESYNTSNTQTKHSEARQEYNEGAEVEDRVVEREMNIESDLSGGEVIRLDNISESDVLEGRVHLTEHQVLQFVERRKSWPKFHEVFMISALDGTGVDDFRDFLMASAQPGPWIFSSQVVTDQNPQELALMTVREKFLDYFPQELPYTMHFSIDYWDITDSELLSITVRVGCQRLGLVKMVVGGGGRKVGRLAREAEQSLRNTFRSEVKLRLNIVYDPSLKKKKGLK
ncbi:hypothetical protein Pmani_019890 [Petrolisthes manimaculis]|uniref:GTPase Era, mitochondrial n=1 Tax=Petrolisthes manimaculis TaxID=1843537 RepID=A0AAE1PHP1_9EUCA|nr:hypothetical protein Pmani_019890 [Petrolisthes manimaculis]